MPSHRFSFLHIAYDTEFAVGIDDKALSEDLITAI